MRLAIFLAVILSLSLLMMMSTSMYADVGPGGFWTGLAGAVIIVVAAALWRWKRR